MSFTQANKLVDHWFLLLAFPFLFFLAGQANLPLLFFMLMLLWLWLILQAGSPAKP